MDPTPPNGSQQNSTELVTYHTSAPTASWVFGGLILVFLMIVVFVPIEPSKFPIIRYLMALAAAFFAIFFVGGVLLRGTVNGLFISATGGFVLFVLIAFVFDPFKVLPSASSPLSSTNPLVTSSPERSDLVKPSVTPAVSPEIAKSTPQPSVVSTPTPPINIIGTVEAVSGDQQIIPLSDWRTFAVRVVDNQRQPIVGAKVAWRTLACGTLV